MIKLTEQQKRNLMKNMKDIDLYNIFRFENKELVNQIHLEYLKTGGTVYGIGKK